MTKRLATYKYRWIIRSVFIRNAANIPLLLIFLIHFFSAVHAQINENTTCKISIHKGQEFSHYAQKLQTDYSIVLAYDDNTASARSMVDVDIRAENPENLLMKLTVYFGLELKKSDISAYLIRKIAASDPQDVFCILLKTIDSNTGKPVPDVIVGSGDNEYRITDAWGETVICGNSGSVLYLQKLDYEKREITLSALSPYTELKLIPAPPEAKLVKVQNSRIKVKTGTTGVIQSNTAGLDAMGVASIFGRDILRTAQMYAGVNAINDASASLRIRGASTEATMLVLDGMPIYKADHFYGILSSINGYYIKDYNLFKNNIPVYYGGKTAGLLEISSGVQPDHTDIVADINYLFTSVKADIALNEKFALKLGARKTYTNLSSTTYNNLAVRERIPGDATPIPVNNLVTTRPDFDFYDLNGRLLYANGRHKISLSGFMSRDSFIDSRRLSFRTRLFPNNDEIFRQSNVWQNTASALTHAFESKQGTLLSRVWYSGYENNHGIHALLRQVINREVKVDTLFINNFNKIKDTGLSVSWQTGKSGLLAGLEWVSHQSEIFLENDRQTLLETNNTGRQWSYFTEKIITDGSSSMQFTPAFRISYLPDLGKLFFLPQFGFSYAINPQWTVKSAAGSHMQYVRMLEHENNLGERQTFFALSNGTSIPVGLSKNVMIGTHYKLEKWRFDVELYYKKLNGAITHATVLPGLRPPAQAQIFSDYKIFTGEASSKGIDFSVIYDFKNWFSMVSYSLSETENRFREIFRNQYFPSSEDSRHQLKWVNSVKAGKWDFSVNYITATGRPYLDLSGLNNTVDRSRIIITDYIRNLSPYHRLDAGIAYHLKISSMTCRLGIQVFNLTNHTNVRYRQFVFRLPGPNNTANNTILGSDVVQLERTFNFGITLHFNK